MNKTQIILTRILMDKETTAGVLHLRTPDGATEFLAYTLEDQVRPDGKKVPKETAIWNGTYKVGVRHHGKYHNAYRNRFGAAHKGVLEVLEVPNFTDILFHSGNNERHTDGCILVGDKLKLRRGDIVMADSRAGYIKMYPKVIDAALAGELELVVSDGTLNRK